MDPRRNAAPADCILVAGFPSSGKSAVVRSLGRQAVLSGRRPALAALECFPSEPRPAWTTAGRRAVPWRSWTSGDVCPDHALVALLPEMQGWAAGTGADLVLVETAGLCCRCSPYPVHCAAVFVADASAGRGALGKVGPMLTTCDLCVLTRPDRITPAERDMLVATARGLGRAEVLTLDGLTGEGSDALWARLAPLLGRSGETNELRAGLPEFYCSYCLGRERVGILEI
ncbi:MAG: hypothetical protein QME96_02815 [Myxococcota bacterium]|nr:hypothetical protein [Myxococcota bacterium]